MVAADNVKGFTLIELLIVLVIMSLLLSLVPPLLSNVMPSVTIKAAANDLYHDIKYVRNMAVLNNRQSSLSLNIQNRSYRSEQKDSGREVSLPADISLDIKSPSLKDSSENNHEIRFFADGSSSGALIYLSTEDKKFTIVVDWLTGKVSILEGMYDEEV